MRKHFKTTQQAKRNMKRIIAMLFLAILFLTACEGEGIVYTHLQQQDVGALHSANASNNATVNTSPGVFEHLQNNLADDYCMGRFSEEEKQYFKREQQAYIEFDPNICDELPQEPLVFTCDGQEIIYYSQERCYDFFMEDMI